MVKYWSGAEWEFYQSSDSSKSESNLLKLNCDKALQILQWNAVLDFPETVRMTGKWYQTFYGKESVSISETTSSQIKEYAEIAIRSNLAWVQ